MSRCANTADGRRSTKTILFESERGQVRLIDLCQGRRQLIIYHFMFGPTWEKDCPRCTALWDESGDGRFRHLHSRDSTFGRGVEVALPSFHLLDLTVLGRQETWEKPKGRVEHPFPALPFATDRL